MKVKWKQNLRGCPFAQLRFPAKSERFAKKPKSDRFTKRPQKMGVDCFPIADNLLPFPNLRRLAIYNNYHTLSHTGHFLGICIKTKSFILIPVQFDFCFLTTKSQSTSLPLSPDLLILNPVSRNALQCSARSAGQEYVNRSSGVCTVNNAVNRSSVLSSRVQ